MNNLTSRQKIMFGVYSMILAMIGDYLLGYKTFSTSSSPEAYMGITWNVVHDWRYATSSILGFNWNHLLPYNYCTFGSAYELHF